MITGQKVCVIASALPFSGEVLWVHSQQGRYVFCCLSLCEVAKPQPSGYWYEVRQVGEVVE